MTPAAPSVRDRIIAAAAAVLAAEAAEVEVEPIGDPTAFDALHIFDGGHRILEREASCTRYEMTIEVVGYVEGEGGPAPTAKRSSLQARVVAAMLTSPALAAVSELVDEEDLRMFTAFLASTRRLSFSQDFTIQFATARTDPSRLA